MLKDLPASGGKICMLQLGDLSNRTLHQDNWVFLAGAHTMCKFFVTVQSGLKFRSYQERWYHFRWLYISIFLRSYLEISL